MNSRRWCFAIIPVLLTSTLPATVGAQPPTYVTQWGSSGRGNSQFDYPIAVATDAAGDVYVVDRNNRRIQKFTGSGAYLTQWGSSGSGNGQFLAPSGVAVDRAGNVYVTDTGNVRVTAINYETVSVPHTRALPVSAGAGALRLQVPALPAAGQTFAVGLELSGDGDIQGLSTLLDFDRDVVEFMGVESGPLLDAQATQGVVLSSKPGNVDVALLGTGSTLRGEGELARALFRVKAGGDARIKLRSADARNAANQPVALDGAASATPIRPSVTSLSVPRPTPFRDGTVLEVALARRSEMTLAVFGIDGRRVRTLASGARDAGVYPFVWDGRDEAGRDAPAGVYYVRLVSGDAHLGRTLVRLR